MADLMEKIVSLCKRRGFIFQSSEIYGGFGSCYDFGPLGVEMKNNIKRAWWREMIHLQKNIVGLDAAILMSPKVWQASGHLTAGFADELVECKKCHRRFEYLPKTLPGGGLPIEEKKKINKMEKLYKDGYCPYCEIKLPNKPRKFNLMMKTFVGPVEDEATTTYLRAETCQGIYINFLNVLNSTRQKVPFGIAQIGKAFRNEITPGNFIYRTREFEQMEMQWFCHSEEANKFFNYWKESRMQWYFNLGINKKNLRAVEISEKERAHYARRQVDIEYKFPFGWQEIEGIHNRGDYDLSNHSKYSGEEFKYFDEETKQKYFPHIIETSAGTDRSFLTFLIDAYKEVKGGRTETTEAKKEVEVLLKLHKDLTPIKVAVLPLVKNKPELVKKAKEVFEILKPYFMTQYDEVGSIGRRYRRQDEIGTLFAVTIDFETLEKADVTVRDRDTMSQERVKIPDLVECLKKQL